MNDKLKPCEKLKVGDRVEFDSLKGVKQYGVIVRIIRNNYIIEYEDNCNYVVLWEKDIRRANDDQTR